MNDFPFSPFFEILERDGFRVTVRDYRRVATALRASGPWTAKRLRTVLMSLLVRDADQKDLFIRRFGDFFESGPETRIPDIDLERAVSDLESLAKKDARPRPERPVRKPIRKPEPPGEKPRRSPLATLIVLLIAAIGLLIFNLIPDQTPDPLPTPTPVPSPTPTPTPTERPKMRVYENTPHVTITYTQDSQIFGKDWQLLAAVTGGLPAVLFAFALFVRRTTQIPDDKAPEYDPEAPRHYRLGQIGGKPPSRMDAEILDFLADFLGYFQSARPGRDLDIEESVKTTLDRGGIPTPVFERRKEIYTVLVLEDTFSGQTEWDPIACELARGLERRGVPVVYGRFDGSPSTFHTEDGSSYLLDDLEDRRGEFLLLIFSDGRHIHRKNDTFILESVARWPMKAWLAYRDARFGDEVAGLAARFGIPVYPANPDGLARAMGVFLTESGTADSSRPPAEPGHSAPVGEMSAWQLERFLGDAHAWAMDCAMVRPVTFSLAEALRREFHPQVPYERLGRLLSLPKTTRGPSGIRFDDSVVAILRAHFAERRSETDQERVLRFLLDEIKACEPEESKKKKGAAWLVWKFHYERVRLELDPKKALKELAKLAADKSPINAFVTSEMAKSDPGSPAIPLRIPPRDPVSRYRLEKMAKPDGKPAARFPVSQLHKTVASILLFVLLAAAAWTGKTVFTAEPETRIIAVNNPIKYPARLEIKTGDTWKMAWGLSASRAAFEVRPDSAYRIAMLSAGSVKTQPLDVSQNKINIDVAKKADEHPCLETVEDIGLAVIRCPKTADPKKEYRSRSWRGKLGNAAPENRLSSIGIVAGEDTRLDDIGETLLKTSSVDVLYRVTLGTHLEETLHRVFDDLGEWANHAQMLVLSDYWKDDLAVLARKRSIGRLITLKYQPNEVDSFRKLFDFNETGVVTENDFLRLKWTVLATGDAGPMMMARDNTLRLRDHPMELSKDDVKAMLKKYNFYDRDWNKAGDFKNDFKDNGDGTITDHATGLMWQQSGSDRRMEYKDVPAYVEKINGEKLGGFDDWRLPTIEELASLLENEEKNGELYIDPVFDERQWWCWSSDRKSGGGVWGVSFYYGDVYWYIEVLGRNVRLVRRGQ